MKRIGFGRGRVIGLLMLALGVAQGAEDAATAGWRDIDPARNAAPARKVLWQADLANWPTGFDVTYGDGATGWVTRVSTAGGYGLRIVKATERGWIAITTKEAVPFAKDAKLQGYASVSSETNDPNYALGFLRITRKGGHYNYYSSLDGRAGGGGPRIHHLINTAPGMHIDKVCRYDMAEAKGAGVTPAIVLAGAASDSIWTDWGVEDLPTALRRWNKYVAERPSRDHSADRMAAADYDRLIAADRDHTAKVATSGNRTVLLVDGKASPPVFFKGWMQFGNDLTKSVYCGKKMAQNGVNVQLVSTRLGATPPVHGWWSRAGYDAKGAVEKLRDAMRMAPDAYFILAVNVSAYPEFATDHPTEAGRQANGAPIVGGYLFARPEWTVEPGKKWVWPSISSTVFADEVAARLRELAAELRRTELSKRIVGVQICGYNDGQLSTPVPDFSPCAFAGFRDWQKARYGAVRWNEAPTFNPGKRFFTPGEDDARIAYHHYLKIAPTLFIEKSARVFKQAMAKDLVVVRWCMSPFKGQFNDALDVTAFAESDVIDILAPQPAYEYRLPGLPVGLSLPIASLRRHGKLLVNEFDLRTYATVHPGDASELRSWWLSKARDPAMWRASYRKLAGQQIAQGMGWWFFDMGGGWYEPEPIASDIGATVKTYEDILARTDASVCTPPASAAFVVDEEGLFLCNTFAEKYDLSDTTPMRGPLQALAACGLPYDMWLAKDFLDHPELAARYRTLVFYGMLAIDPPRARLLDSLKGNGRTLVFLSRTGISGGIDATGFGVRRAHNKFEDVVREPGTADEMQSLMFLGLRTRYLDPVRLPPKGPWCPDRWEIVETPDLTVRARYADDRSVALAERRGKDWKGVYVASVGALSPGYFNRLVRESGGYAALDRPGVTVDLGNGFLSLHCLIAGHYEFRLPPGVGGVTNLKTGDAVATAGGILPLDLTAGETRWYALRPATARATAGAPKIIFDTDMYTDYDDVGALAMLHAFADAGECEILAVGCNTWGDGNRSVAACEVINGYYGRGDLPVGCARAGGRNGAGAKGHGLPARYPQFVRHLVSTEAPPAVDVYRAALAAAPDASVVLCSVGFLNNVADLLRTDRDLVARKVRLWVCMACKYPNGKEYNSMCDPAASDFAFRNWPKTIPIVWTDYDYGRTCYSGRAVAELPGEGNPVKDAFAARLASRARVAQGPCGDTLAGHQSWDQTAVLIAVRGWEPYFNLERGRYRMVGTDGADEWVADAAENAGRVTEKMPKAEVGRLLDEVMCRLPRARAR